MSVARRTIPSSGETIPVLGCGTWSVFDIGPEEQRRAPLRTVLSAMLDAGATMIDSSPMYGRAEGVVGDLLAALPTPERAFVATKVWTRGRREGIRQMERSMALLRRDRIDLMQIHNLVDWREHLATLRDWKREGRIRYLGVTHYTASAYDELAAVLRSETLDFVQLNYSLDEREAEERLLPLAHDRGIAVIVNRPFGGGGLVKSLARRPLPAWAAEAGCGSWAALCLKFVLAHPAVTCAIPATGDVAHMRDNLASAAEPLPDGAFSRRILAAYQSI